MVSTIKVTVTISAFWYRRIAEILWLVSVIIAGLWCVGTFVGNNVVGESLLVPFPALIGAILTAVASLIAYLMSSKRQIDTLILVSYLMLCVTTLALIYDTGNTASPFIALWMLLSIFAGLFGGWGLIPVALMSNGYLGYLYMNHLLFQEQLVIFILAFEIPIIASYMIWHRQTQRDSEKDTTYKALVKELSQVANKSEIVINAIADGVAAVDGKGIIQLINPAAQQIIGWGKQDAIGLDYRSVLQLFNAQDHDVPDDIDPVQQCLHTNKTIQTDSLTIATTSGKKLMASILVSPVGQLGAGAIVVFRDVTSQRSEEHQQAEFISTASHEMRTPVAAIEGYLGLSLNPQTATIDEKARMYLTKAHESAQHLGRLFQDLLDVSKTEDGRLANNPTPIDVVNYARDITNSFTTIATGKNIVLVFKPDVSTLASQRVTPAFYVSADPDHFREVLSNLIENGIKYTKAGDVTIDITGDEEHVSVSIHDTGIGIPAEDIPHLFQKFYRVDSTDTREIGGTGLGLYLCRRLVETMGGRIWVTSEYGRGSTFSFELPRLQHTDAMLQVENAAKPTPPIEPKTQIL